MSLTQNLAVFILGLIILIVGAEALIRGAVHLAKSLGVSPFMIGLTLVAFGTSAPELVVNVSAVWQGSSGLAIGNVVGSNIANIGLILGITALIRPMVAQNHMRKCDMPIVIVLSGLLWVFVSDGTLSRVDAGLFLVGFLVMGVYLIRTQANEQATVAQEASKGLDPQHPSQWRNVLYVLIGLAGLVGGAHLMVESATAIARIWGVSEFIIGLTILAIGTSLPELASSGAAAYRGHSDIAIGNVVGSNMFNILLILGVTGLVQPLQVDYLQIRMDLLVMVSFAVLLMMMLLRSVRISQREGAVLLVAYIAYVTWKGLVAAQSAT